MDPVGFTSELAKNWSFPSHIVLFDSDEKQLRDFLISHSFTEVHATAHNFTAAVLHLCQIKKLLLKLLAMLALKLISGL